MPEASSIDPGPVALSFPLARLASKNLTEKKMSKIVENIVLIYTRISDHFPLIVTPVVKCIN